MSKDTTRRGMLHRQFELAKQSLDKQKKFESGGYEKRIAELEAELAACQDSAIQTVRDTFESDAIAAWKKKYTELEAERDATYNRGLERAAEIALKADTDLPYGRATAQQVYTLIRKEIK